MLYSEIFCKVLRMIEIAKKYDHKKVLMVTMVTFVPHTVSVVVMNFDGYIHGKVLMVAMVTLHHTQ